MDDLLELKKKRGVLDFSLFGYRAGYILPRPWKLVEEIGREIKWAWQRVFRGWDDRVVWSIDVHLARYMPAWLLKLESYTNVIPTDIFNPEDFGEDGDVKKEAEELALYRWKNVLEEIAGGFLAARAIQNYEYHDKEEYDMLMNIFNDGMKQFTKHFFSLWD